MLDSTHHSIVNHHNHQNGNGARRRPRHRLRHRSRHQFHNGRRAAVLRAVTAARLWLNGQAPTLAAAAACCGASLGYVWAALILIKSENAAVMSDVLAGRVPLITAAKQLKGAAEIVTAYRKSNAKELVTFGKIVGLTDVWDHVINPAI
jgi:hypothetical protein